MMQSAPISRAAATVFNRCCATSVSTVGTPVMSMMAMSERVCDDRFQQILHHHLRARAIQSADQRQRQNVLPQPHHRRGEFQQLLLLAGDDLFTRLLKRLRGEQAEPVQEQRGFQHLIRQRSWGSSLAAHAAE